MARPSSKDAILDAAENVVIEDGAAQLTLDAVAEKAGVSKGGVLYHFPSKEALLTNMMGRLLQRGDARREDSLAATPEGPGQRLKADIAALLLSDEHRSELCAGLLSTVATEPRLTQLARGFHERRFAAHAAEVGGGGTDPEFLRKAVILLAADGLFLLEMLNVSPFDPAQRSALIEELMRISEQIESAPNNT